MRILIVGDTHGNAEFLRTYIYPLAMTLDADAIVQLGDFGAWEHRRAGVEFMSEIGELGQRTTIPLYWLHGNHDKHSDTLKTYTPDSRGFYPCREFLFYIPQGHAWTWGGVDMRAFGGAYSVDKTWRVQHEKEKGEPGTLWFPEEEMTDAQMTRLLDADSSRKQIIFSHDKPYSASPGWNRKNFPACVPNQLRLERALRAHKPDYWFHGHLHYGYSDVITHGSSADGATLDLTLVYGLEPDWDAAEPGWKRVNTWALADLDGGGVTVKLGRETFVDAEILQDRMATLG